MSGSKMMTSDEEKRWLVVGIALSKVVAPALHDTIKQGMNTHYMNLDAHCGSLATPCTLTTLQYSQVNKDAVLKKLNFKNINSNSLHGNRKLLYNYSIVSHVDLAKLYLPDYLAKFTAFDESLDMSAILQLLGWSSPTPLYPSPDPTLPIQPAADDVRKNVRNPWGHCDITSWTEAFYNDCFTKLETLIRSVGLSADVEKTTLDQLTDWKTKGCELVMGHAVDKSLLSLVQLEVVKLQKQWEASQEIKVVLKQLESEMQQLKRGYVQTVEKIQDVKNIVARDNLLTGSNVQHKPGACSLESFNVKSCQSKLAEYYLRKATVPTSLWSSKYQVDVHKIYTRLSWIREDHSATGPSLTELEDYTEIFRRNEKGLLPRRILVQGLTGMGKSTFVKKLAVDWAEFHLKKEGAGKGEKTEGELQWKSGEAEFPGKFEIAVIVKLRDISHCQSLREAIRESYLLPEEESAMIDGLLNYITANQEKVLLVFDGYDEYSYGKDSEIYQIFKGSKLRNCTTLVTSRPSKADELKEFADVHTEVKGFEKSDIRRYVERILISNDEVSDLVYFLHQRSLMDSARVPLLLLFYCLLWKEGKRDSFPETRTELYLEIIKCLLTYSDKREADNSGSYSKREDYNEILVELGKVALDALLKDDLVFDFDQLSEAVQSKASLIIGLLEVQEYTQNVRPAGKVSFIHKSIQEFLAAWYISHQCIPQGFLGGIIDAVQRVESCFVFENVLLFVCGLSVEGARKIFELLKSVRISDPRVDLPENFAFPSCVRPYYLYRREWEEIFLILTFECLLQSPNSRKELLGDCLSSIGEIVPVSNSTAQALSKVANLTQLTEIEGLIPLKFLLKNNLKPNMFPECLNVPVSISESGEVVKVKDVWTRFEQEKCPSDSTRCSFESYLTLTNGQIHFYITDIDITCTEHARIISQIALSRFDLYDSCSTSQSSSRCTVCGQGVQCSSPSVSNKQQISESCFKFLEKVKLCVPPEEIVMECVSAAVSESEVQRSISLYLPETRTSRSVSLSSTSATNLASLLPKFTTITAINIDLGSCNGGSVTTLLDGIAHKIVQLKLLQLLKVDLISEAAIALGRCFHEMLELRELCIAGKGNTLESADMESSFGKLCKELPLKYLQFTDFRLGSSTAPLRDCFGFFPSLRSLALESLGINEHGITVLSEGFRHVPNLTELSLSRNPLSHGLSSVMSQVRNLPMLQELCLSSVSCSEEDASCVPGSFKHMPNMNCLDLSNNPLGHGVRLIVSQVKNLPKLERLYLSNVGCSEEDANFVHESFKHLPNLEFFDLSNNPLGHGVVSIVSQVKNLPKLERLYLRDVGCSEEDAKFVHESFKHMPNLEFLDLSNNPLGHGVRLIVSQVKNLPKLERLYLSNVGCSEEDANFVHESFKHLPNLEFFDLSNNPLGHGVVSIVSQVKNLPKLERLYLRDVGCSEEDAKFVHESFKHMPNLEFLDLSNNPLGHGVRLIVSQVKNLPKLERLYLSNVGCSEGDVVYLSEGINSMLSRKKDIMDKTYILLDLSDNPLGHGVKSLISSIVCFPRRGEVCLRWTGCSDEDVNYVSELLRERGHTNHVCVNRCEGFFSLWF